MDPYISEIPAPPRREDWLFLQELQQPEQRCLHWTRTDFEVPPNHLDLTPGISLAVDFPDAECLLETALEDFRRLLVLAELPENGSVPCRFRQEDTGGSESYRLQVNGGGITLGAKDTEACAAESIFWRIS